MKKIILKQMKLLNFKGVRLLSIEFGTAETSIYGQNGTGKTTIFDAFIFLFFGKDSTGRTDFNIKTLGPDNEPFHKMSHEVSALINVDGDEVTIRRTFKENWPTKKGTATETFSGHTQNFYWNDVPLNETEFKKKIAAILDEGLFKLITNTSYFACLKWQDRRLVLEKIAGEITNQMVFDSIITGANKQDFTSLLNALNAKKSLYEYRSEIANKKKLIKDEKDLLPSRIDEAKRSLPDYVDYASIEEQLDKTKEELFKVEDLINNKTLAIRQKQEVINNKLREVQTLTNNARNIEFAEKNKVQDRKRERDQQVINLKTLLRNNLDNASRNAIEVSNQNARKKSLQSDQQALRNKWVAVDKELLEFKENEFTCPACKRDYEATDIEAKKAQMLSNFNQDKSTRLNKITAEGKKVTEDIAVIDAGILTLKTKDGLLQSEGNDLKQQIAVAEEENTKLSSNDQKEFDNAMALNEEHKRLLQQISVLNDEINIPIDGGDNADLITKKREISLEIQAYQQQLSLKGQREKIDARITELQNQESQMANDLARLEGIEFSIMQFEKSKMGMLETKVNSMFKIVKFKMFEQQINGGQVPCCETLINGVPYSDANTASKIQAGVDIINTLCRHYNISAPIFIDNRESVFIIPESESQIISLIASKPDKQLRIEQAA
ncbi:MAG: hypothetical protein H0W75_00660 [Chitinophagaceae bacterium]|nr:hypothetical protein [Chitinophagaceae bacterium]